MNKPIEEMKIYSMRVEDKQVLVDIIEGRKKLLKLLLTPDNERECVEMEDPNDPENIYVKVKHGNCIPIRYDALRLTAGEDYVLVAAKNPYSELIVDDNDRPIVLKEFGEDYYAENVVYNFGKVMDTNIELKRSDSLANKFNAFWQEFFSTQENYYAKMKTAQMIKLKRAVSNINNIITLMVTLNFCDVLHKNGVISKEQLERMKKKVEETSANANGYDIGDPKSKTKDPCDVKIIAEIKCNIPVKGNRYGANQRENILEDIKNLRNGKKEVHREDVEDYLKFMVLLDDGGITADAAEMNEKEAKERIKEAVEDIKKAAEEKYGKIEIWNTASEKKSQEYFNPDTVYIAILKLRD